MNLVEGTCAAMTARRLSNRRRRGVADRRRRPPARRARRSIYGIRPDHLTLANGGGVRRQVEVVEPTGAETLVFGAPASRDPGRVPRALQVQAGPTHALMPMLDRVHLFDARSGANLSAVISGPATETQFARKLEERSRTLSQAATPSRPASASPPARRSAQGAAAPARAQEPTIDLKPEKGATLRVLRWQFVVGDETMWLEKPRNSPRRPASR